MQKPLYLLPLAALLSQCSPSNPTVASDRLAELSAQPARKPKLYSIQVQFKDQDGKMEILPTLAARPGKETKASLLRDVIFATDYAPADTSQVRSVKTSKSPAPVVPVTPTGFAKREVGYTVRLSAKPQGAFVAVQGSIVHERLAGFSRAPGEALSPIIDAKTKEFITDNCVMLPSFVRSETPVYIVGLPGVPRVIDLPGSSGSATITITPQD